MFEIQELSTSFIQRMLSAKVWSNNCPLSLNRLRLLKVSHYNFKGQIQQGQIVVLDKIAGQVLNIFEALLLVKFPIYNIQTIDRYRGDDKLSMQANNSSCFNFRVINDSKQLSMHSYGLAIDINPIQNPCIIIKEDNQVEIWPKAGTEFLNRQNLRPGMVEPIIHIFHKYGFTEWGGNWNTPIDYHHFQLPKSKINHDLL